MTMETLISQKIQTPLGILLAATSKEGLCLLEYSDVPDRLTKHTKQLEKTFKVKMISGQSPILIKLSSQLKEYFDGERKSFDLPLDYRGTEFQEHAWNALTKIPYGETRSYKEQAIAILKEINNAKANTYIKKIENGEEIMKIYFKKIVK